MFQNEQKITFKGKDKNPKTQIFASQFYDQHIPSSLFLKKTYKSQVLGFNTQRITTKSSPQKDQKYHAKQEMHLYRKFISKGQESTPQKDQRSIKQIFKRRVKSEKKTSKTNLQIESKNQQNKSQSQINFAKKLIQDIKKQTLKMIRPNLRYSVNKIHSRSVQIHQNKKIQNRQIQKENSIQKLKPSFSINEVKFYSSNKSLDKPKDNKTQSVSQRNRTSRQKVLKLQDRIIFQVAKSLTRSDGALKQALKKALQPINSYSQYIKSSSQKKYEIKLNFLSQYLNIQQRQEALVHIDFSCLKLVQSIHSCLIDIFEAYLSKKKQKQKPENNINYEVVREYVSVYFQTYSKIKTEFVVCEILFKNVKKKIAQYFILQRAIFYFIIDLSSEFKIVQNLTDLKRIITILKLSEQILTTITNMLQQEKNNSKSKQDSLIDTFKSLRLTRQIDKRLPSLKQNLLFLQSFKQKQTKQQLSSDFNNLISSLQQLAENTEKQQNFQLITIFQLEQYFNWNYFMIPPLFYLPMSPSKPYTLVIDLDGTLIFYNQQTRILKYRPYMDRFLQAMQKNFELIIFSSYPKERTDIIVNQIERDDNIFAYRLYKSHMVFQEGSLRKNMGYLGRNLQKLIFIDDEQKNTEWLPLNSFKIKSFIGDKQDKQLLYLLDWLKNLIQVQPDDVRQKMKKPQQILDQIQQIEEISSTIQPSIQYLEANQSKKY